MDRAAKELFTGCCLTFIFLAVGLGLGCWLLLVEFGAAFNESHSDQVHRVVASSALVILNPFGSIGWFLGVKNLVPPAVGISGFILGSAISAALYGTLTNRLLTRRKRRIQREEQVSGGNGDKHH